MPVQRKTRLTRIKEQEVKRSGVRYIFLTIGVIAFLVLVGLPFVIPRLTQIVDHTTGRGNGGSSDDTTPPPPPNLKHIPMYVNENTVEVSGNTESGAKVYLVINGRDQEYIADAQGSFSTVANLQDGENEVFAFAEDAASNRSNDSTVYKVIVDKEPPEVQINSPKDGSIFFDQENSVQIEGQTEADASVRVNDRVAIVNRDGKFSVRVNLNEGGNNFDIVATDQAGNETKTTLTVSYTP